MSSNPSVAELHIRGHLKPLDGVRGLAILMVIFSHAFQSNSDGNGILSRAIGTVFGYGIFGVDLFFVLSGFLITGVLVDSLDGEGFFRRFYARRALRIFPLYYAVLLTVFLLTPMLHLDWHGMGWLMLGYLQNLHPTQIATFSPGAGLGLNHFWSLAVEEQFYFLWPAVVYFVRGGKKLFWTTLAISAGALVLRLLAVEMGVGPLAIHMTTILRADSLLLGGALALLYRSDAWTAVQRLAPWGTIAASVIVFGSIALLGSDVSIHPPTSLAARLWIDGFRYSVVAVGAGSLIAWSLRVGSVCGWIFEATWLRFLGRYSYGIYILHMVPLPMLLRVQRALIVQVAHSKMLAVVGAGVSTLTLAILAAYLSFHLFEKPFLRLKDSFSYVKRESPVSVLVAGRRSEEVNASLIAEDLVVS